MKKSEIILLHTLLIVLIVGVAVEENIYPLVLEIDERSQKIEKTEQNLVKFVDENRNIPYIKELIFDRNKVTKSKDGINNVVIGINNAARAIYSLESNGFSVSKIDYNGKGKTTFILQ